MVKCQIVPLSATANGPISVPSFFGPLILHLALFSSLSIQNHFFSFRAVLISSISPVSSSLSSFSSSSSVLSIISSLSAELPPSVSSSLPSINFFLLPHLLSFPIQYFPTLPAPKCARCAHTHTHTFSPLSLYFSGVGRAFPPPPERVLPLLHVRLTSWGHADLYKPLPGITSHFLLMSRM